LAKLAPAITTLARAEGLEAHARSVEVRLALALPKPRGRARMAPYSPPTGAAPKSCGSISTRTRSAASPRVIEFLREHLTAEPFDLSRIREAKRELAAFFGVAPGRVLLTNGTDEAIQVLVNTYVDDGDEVHAAAPSYAMYAFTPKSRARRSSKSITQPPGPLAFPLEELLAAITPRRARS
jgi:histidinol-phosphate aminotransferase